MSDELAAGAGVGVTSTARYAQASGERLAGERERGG